MKRGALCPPIGGQLAVVIIAAFLAACQATDARNTHQWSQAQWAEFIVFTPLWEQDRVLNGYYVQPEVCRRDLSLVDAPVSYVPAEVIDHIFSRIGLSDVTGMRAGGAAVKPEYSKIAGVRPGIYINEDLRDWERGIAVHHERCHWATDWEHSDWKPQRH